jgi:hypothetical protein
VIAQLDSGTNPKRRYTVLRNIVRSILGLLFVAAATWLANYVTERIFGPEETGTPS